ncbi:hypothetical protein P691DRAFT_786840 [Macrolepiota fuliginosa MF-IS2]|uniref:Uncharacterized protein n=1 Tax=Macrolepiota fuliginosa MF-IS2 TaxID=1400762 RepID=A0A9P6C085_9AGAR|nr:hypothetical protein P691DRAFT_786840 [Macrolepiota fuliginosa MF-IS2]
MTPVYSPEGCPGDNVGRWPEVLGRRPAWDEVYLCLGWIISTIARGARELESVGTIDNVANSTLALTNHRSEPGGFIYKSIPPTQEYALILDTSSGIGRLIMQEDERKRALLGEKGGWVQVFWDITRPGPAGCLSTTLLPNTLPWTSLERVGASGIRRSIAHNYASKGAKVITENRRMATRWNYFGLLIVTFTFFSLVMPSAVEGGFAPQSSMLVLFEDKTRMNTASNAKLSLNSTYIRAIINRENTVFMLVFIRTTHLLATFVEWRAGVKYGFDP